jgi:ATP-dependent Clp protease ATP-binding subunit ClpA
MSRLIGAAPGYVGFEEGGMCFGVLLKAFVSCPNLGQLTEAVRRKPYGAMSVVMQPRLFLIPLLAVVLLDELEKAHKVVNVFRRGLD